MIIVSGGQTGVDRAALDAALEVGLPCGGWCPKGRRAEDGRIADRYPLKEMEDRSYRARTRANVRDSQATLILAAEPARAVSDGVALTADEARRLGRPLLVVDPGDEAAHEGRVAEILAWIAANDIGVLNIAGPRESTSPGVYGAARRMLTAVFAALTR
jgi:hypothetical protein